MSNYRHGNYPGKAALESCCEILKKIAGIRVAEEFFDTLVRVLSSLDPNRAEPDIIREALNVDLAVEWNVIYDSVSALSDLSRFTVVTPA